MAARLLPIFTFLLLLTACGYVGPVLPPSPELPQTITDLTVVERGDQLVINFTTPARTTDALPIPHFSHVDLRIGTYVVPFDFDRWASTATPYDISPPPPADPDNPLSVPLNQKLSIAGWVGKRVAVAVRTAVKRKDSFSAWSNRVVIDVVPPIATPVVELESTAKGIQVSWKPVAGASEYRISRQASGENAAVALGTSKSTEYLDETSQYDVPYVYSVIAANGLAESLPSVSKPKVTTDIFSPSVPTGLTALAAPTAVEVSWQRSPETDLKGYLLFRSVNNGPYQQVKEILAVPTYSDRDVQHGNTYHYEVSAVDQKDNGSARSAPVEVAY